jgi:octaprenyl-diphosphate synthase
VSIIRKIQAPIKKEMNLFEDKFKKSLSSNIILLDKIMHYIIKRKGKQMRPMFVFLTAKLFNKFNEKTYRAASMIELLHTATLVHDDVIDEANFRRGVFSINALWKNKVAVLVGDFLLSRGLLLAVKNKEYELLEIMSATVQDMSEGELLQIEKTRKLDITESVYYEIIRKKTASLIAACCSSGANSVEESNIMIEKMRIFGEKAGIAFQIKDDLFDYSKSTLIGKSTGIDIRENHNKNEKKVGEVIELVKQNGGLDYAKKIMLKFYNEALEILDDFEDNEAKKSLNLLLDYVINRKK